MSIFHRRKGRLGVEGAEMASPQQPAWPKRFGIVRGRGGNNKARVQASTTTPQRTYSVVIRVETETEARNDQEAKRDQQQPRVLEEETNDKEQEQIHVSHHLSHSHPVKEHDVVYSSGSGSDYDISLESYSNRSRRYFLGDGSNCLTRSNSLSNSSPYEDESYEDERPTSDPNSSRHGDESVSSWDPFSDDGYEETETNGRSSTSKSAGTSANDQRWDVPNPFPSDPFSNFEHPDSTKINLGNNERRKDHQSPSYQLKPPGPLFYWPLPSSEATKATDKENARNSQQEDGDDGYMTDDGISEILGDYEPQKSLTQHEYEPNKSPSQPESQMSLVHNNMSEYEAFEFFKCSVDSGAVDDPVGSTCAEDGSYASDSAEEEEEEDDDDDDEEETEEYDDDDEEEDEDDGDQTESSEEYMAFKQDRSSLPAVTKSPPSLPSVFDVIGNAVTSLLVDIAPTERTPESVRVRGEKKGTTQGNGTAYY